MLNVGVNSWATLAEANEYFSMRFGAVDAWGSFTDNEKEILLITSYKDLNGIGGLSLPASTTNQKILQAQYEFAWYLYRESENMEKREGLRTQGVSEFEVLDFSESFDNPWLALPPKVQNLLEDYYTGLGVGFVEINREIEN